MSLDLNYKAGRVLGTLGDLICISLDFTKNLEQFLVTSGPSGPYMYGCLFFKKMCLNLETFGTFGTSYVCLYILLKS